MSASATLTMADAADAPGGLSAAQWRQLAGLWRWFERDDAVAQALHFAEAVRTHAAHFGHRQGELGRSRPRR
jgi:plasmid stabilization system protein ParE